MLVVDGSGEAKVFQLGWPDRTRIRRFRAVGSSPRIIGFALTEMEARQVGKFGEGVEEDGERDAGWVIRGCGRHSERCAADI